MDSNNRGNLQKILDSLKNHVQNEEATSKRNPIFFPKLYPSQLSPFVRQQERYAKLSVKQIRTLLANDAVQRISEKQSEDAYENGMYPKVYSKMTPNFKALPSERFPLQAPSLDQGAVGNRQGDLYRPRDSQIVDYTNDPNPYIQGRAELKPTGSKRPRYGGKSGEIQSRFVTNGLNEDEIMDYYEQALQQPRIKPYGGSRYDNSLQ